MKNYFLKKILALLAGAAILASMSINIASADDDDDDIHILPRMIVLGDSLSDVGNLPATTFLAPGNMLGLVIPPPPRYDRGRFSNGPVAVEYLAKRYGLFLKPSKTGFGHKDSVSFAYGGSGTGVSNLTPGGFPVPGLLGQVDQYIEYTDSLGGINEAGLNSSTLFVIWSGSNDYLIPPPSGINPQQTIANITTAILTLHARGARYFLISNLPDLGKIPLCLQLGVGVCNTLSSLTNTHNNLLRQALTDIEATQNDIKLILFDAHRVFNRVLAHPHQYGFSGNVQALGPASGCLLQNPSAFNPANCDLVSFNTNQVFWDEQHPTTKVHKILGHGMWRAALLGDLPFPWYEGPEDEGDEWDE